MIFTLVRHVLVCHINFCKIWMIISCSSRGTTTHTVLIRLLLILIRLPGGKVVCESKLLLISATLPDLIVLRHGQLLDRFILQRLTGRILLNVNYLRLWEVRCEWVGALFRMVSVNLSRHF